MSAPIRSQSLLRQLRYISTHSRSAAAQKNHARLAVAPSTTSRVPVNNPALQTRTILSTYNRLQTRHFTSNSPRSSSSTSTSTSATNNSSPSSLIPDTPNTTTYYTIFPDTLPTGPPPTSPFEIHLSSLRREFLQLQSKIHPDKYPPGPTKQAAEALSARINEAYRTLLDPLSRGQYILHEFHGIDVTAEDGASQHPLDPELLMDVMEVQETIEEVSGDADAEAKIAELKSENDGRVLECVRVLGERFDGGDIEGATAACVRLKFWYGVAGALREWEPGMSQIRLVH